MSPHQDRQLVIHAVLMALWQRPGHTSVILHSDRGCQFTSEEYHQFLEAHHVICSMSAVGSCADNAAAESFFGVLKRERVNRQHYQTRAEARADIFDYIERCHNPRQRRRLDMQQQADRLLTQPSVISG
jgi:putative transposase